MKRGKLEAVEGKIAGQVFVVPQEGEISVGRVPENEIVVVDPRVSRKHCIFFMTPEGVRVEDKGSSNGTHINGERHKSALLRHGDSVRTGSVTFRFEEEELQHHREETREFEEVPPSPRNVAPKPGASTPSPAFNPIQPDSALERIASDPPAQPPRPKTGAYQRDSTTPEVQPGTAGYHQRLPSKPAEPKPATGAGAPSAASPSPAAPKPAKKDPMVGKVLGDYEIQDLLGKGAVGAVYKALQTSTGRTVAYKVLHSDINDNNTAVQRFIREAKTGAQLRHPTIMTVYDLGKEASHLYLAMEYVDGDNLHNIVSKNGPLEQKVAAAMFCSLADGLFHAHAANIVHRDLKPANIMVTSDGKPKLTDLGLAKSLDSSEVQVTAMGTLLGTPGYMAPEQAQGSPDLDSRVDIYSLGATLYYAVTRKHPYSGKNMLEVIKRSLNEDPVNPIVHNSRLSLAFVKVIQKAMKRDLAGRYQTCQELGNDIRQFL